MSDEFRIVNVSFRLRLKIDQPVVDWIPELIESNLSMDDGEDITNYWDSEPVECEEKEDKS